MATTTPSLRTDADTVVLLQQAAGIALIPKPTALTRLNYFDGKFLRATDLQAEQEYHRRLQQLATRAGGSGVVDGFDLQLLAGDQLELAPGLAVDAEGRVLFMPMEAAVQIDELIRRSSGTSVAVAAGRKGSAVFTLCETAAVTATTPVVAGTSLYVLGLSHAEALCGQEDVFGKPCVSACASGTERPLRLEGVVLRALPLQLASALPDSKAEQMQTLHLRSRVAAAWFADEARQVEHLISGAGLLSSLWCRGAPAATGAFVPLAVLARAGGHTVFMDAWTARRECMDGTPKRYWQWRLHMRPWDVFMAQVLQFQCQLRDAWSGTPTGTDDPCADLRKAVVEVGDILTQLDRQYQASSARLALRETATIDIGAVPLSRTLLASAVKRAGAARGTLVLQPSARVLIRRGIVELPSAGYLPVAPGSAFPVNEQVRRLLGEGVDLRFCVVRPDFVAHALEEAQHMQRISLLQGLDNPQQKEEVDILVPDGQILNAGGTQGAGWAVRLAHVGSGDKLQSHLAQRNVMTGAARSEQLPGGAVEFYFAGLLETASRDAALAALKSWAAERDNGLEQTLWKSVDLQRTVGATAAAAAAHTATAAAAVNPKSAAARKAAPRAAAKATAEAPEPTPQQLAARFTALREESVAYRLNALQRVATTATTAGISHFPGLNTAAGGKDNDHTAMWLALKSEVDPLTVAEGGRVDMSMDLSLISPKASGTQYVDIGVVGAQFIVEQRVASGQRVVVQGTLRGAAIIAGLVGTLANAQRGLQFSVPAIVSHEPAAEGSVTRVEIDFSALLFDNRGFLGLERLGVRVQTAQLGQLAEVGVQLAAQGVTLDLAARLTRSDAVLQLGNPLRAVSETAIDVIATRESAANFATQARSDLFGQRPPQADALSIRATLDWVLFHRRRNKQCGAAPTAPVLEQRRYEIHHVKVRTEAQLRSARAAVLGANAAAIRKAGFAPIGAVAFDGGRSNIVTPTAELLQDWAGAQPGNRMRFGAIGSQGAAQSEGDALAQARLAGLELTLAQGTPERALENQVLPALPALGLAGWDGAVFLITQDVATPCHDVIVVDSRNTLKTFVTLARRSGLVAAMAEFGLDKLAHVDFEQDGVTPQSASVAPLKLAWGESGPPDSQAVVFRSATATDTQAVQRTAAILQLLGTGSDDIGPLQAADLAQVTPCAGLSVLVRAQVQVRTDPVLLGFALWRDGSFVVNADTPPFKLHTFVDFKPADAAAFGTEFKALLDRQPNLLTVATQGVAEQAAALEIRKVGDDLITQLGYRNINVSNVQVLGEAEIKAIEARGHPRASWRFVVFLGMRV